MIYTSEWDAAFILHRGLSVKGDIQYLSAYLRVLRVSSNELLDGETLANMQVCDSPRSESLRTWVNLL